MAFCHDKGITETTITAEVVDSRVFLIFKTSSLFLLSILFLFAIADMLLHLRAVLTNIFYRLISKNQSKLIH